MTIAVCPGTFDPVTLGHVDVFARAARLFDEVVVAVGVNAAKRRLFGDDERIDLVRAAVDDLPNVRVEGFDGLLTDFCATHGAVAVVKGLRGPADFGYELPMAQMNEHLGGVETVFVAARPAFAHVSSSLVKEVAGLGGDVAPFLAPAVHRRLLARLGERAAERAGE